MSTIHWETIKEYKEILFQKHGGIAKISINRPHVHNAFTPLTVNEMIKAMELARQNTEIGAVILTGEGGKAFCSGGDQSVRGHGGYVGGLIVHHPDIAPPGHIEITDDVQPCHTGMDNTVVERNVGRRLFDR